LAAGSAVAVGGASGREQPAATKATNPEKSA